MFNLGFGELVVILVVALLFLGPTKLPEIATGLGKIIRQIRKATADIKQDIELDDMIRKPLQELRDAATLPPEELKRRDQIKEAQRKAAEEDAKRRELAAKAAEEASRKREADAEAERQKKASDQPGAAEMPLPSLPKDAVSAKGTMIAMVPPPAEDVQTLTPIPDLHTPAPGLNAPPRLPPPPPLPRPSMGMRTAPSDATVIDLHAQMNAARAVAANETLAAGTAPARPQVTTPSKSNPVQSSATPDATKKD